MMTKPTIDHNVTRRRPGLRAGAAIALVCCLFWLIATTSFPFVIAETDPDRALKLNPDNPVALIALAEQKRKKLLAVMPQNLKPELQSEQDGVAKFAKPALTRAEEVSVADSQALREEIKSLARRAIKADPLNATAFRLLAEQTTDVAQARALMQHAAKRSRRESIAYFWLLNDSVQQSAYSDALRYADVLLRSRPQLASYVMTYLMQIAASEDHRTQLVKVLASDPPWRKRFFQFLPKSVKDQGLPLALMLALQSTPSPTRADEQKWYLDHLIRLGEVNVAYYTWLQLRPADELANIKFVINPNFESIPSGLPFDWTTGRSQNAVVEFIAPRTPKASRALHINFGEGRIRLSPVVQTVMLPPGAYQFSTNYRGELDAKRGLVWSVSCLSGKRETLGQSEMLLGKDLRWRTVNFQFHVPQSQSCAAQRLKLTHDARSASEQFISGTAWFDNVDIVRIESDSAAR